MALARARATGQIAALRQSTLRTARVARVGALVRLRATTAPLVTAPSNRDDATGAPAYPSLPFTGTAPAADIQSRMRPTCAWLPAVAVLALAPSATVWAFDPPVVTLTYETARGIELDDEEELEPSYVRHTFVASARQRLGDQARVAVPLRLTIRTDPQAETPDASRTVSFQPRLDVDVTDRLDLGTELILRHSTDPQYVTTGGRLQSRLRLGDFVVDGWLKPLFDTYADQPERNRQLYTAAVGVVYTHDAVRLSTRYRGTARFALGEMSDVEPRFSHLVNVTLRVDLAKVP